MGACVFFTGKLKLLGASMSQIVTGQEDRAAYHTVSTLALPEEYMYFHTTENLSKVKSFALDIGKWKAVSAPKSHVSSCTPNTNGAALLSG